MENPYAAMGFAAFYLFSLLVGLPLATALTLLLLARFRSRVVGLMRTRGPGLPAGGPEDPPHREATGAGELGLEVIQASRESARRLASEGLKSSTRAARRAALLYLIPGSALPFVLVTICLVATSIGSGLETPTDWATTLFVLYLLNATPALVASVTVLGGRLRFLFAVLLLQLVLLWAFDRAVDFQALRLWLLLLAGPTAAVLLLSGRRLRAVGPGVYAATVLIVCGVGLGQLLGWRWVMYRLGLSWEELSELYGPFLKQLGELPLAERASRLGDFARDPRQFVPLPEVPPSLTIQFLAISLLAVCIGVGGAWLLSRWMSRSFETRRASDLMIRVDVQILIFTLAVSIAYSAVVGLTAAWGLAGFAAYWPLSRWILRRTRQSEEQRPRPLLLLRVFGYAYRTQALLEELQQRWRHLGPIQLIAGADIAYSTVELYEFLQFLQGRLGEAFVQSRDNLEKRLVDTRTMPDPDGRYRINDFFCYDNTWRMTVSALATSTEVVLMDLRGFSAANHGCIFEIEQLLATVDPRRVVLVVDGTTEVPFLRQTLQAAWLKGMGGQSDADSEEPSLRILEAAASRRWTADTLLGLLYETS